MPDETPVYRLPFPVGTDRVQDGDDAIAGLAWTVEETFRTGQVSVLTNENGAGLIVPNPVLRSNPRFVALTYMETPGLGALNLRWLQGSTTAGGIYLQALDAASNPLVGVSFLVAWLAICP